ncbi:hypothetical protein SK128_028668 [Halocaridina rubra]|uniref:KIX domain-containing protein n=1 Tax=Halocaridina rubra TaxID=373956 RepID=A0AAN8XJE7_HALRR
MDDTIIGRTINGKEDIHALQEDLNRLSEWSDKWQMEFNVEKCKGALRRKLLVFPKLSTEEALSWCGGEDDNAMDISFAREWHHEVSEETRKLHAQNVLNALLPEGGTFNPESRNADIFKAYARYVEKTAYYKARTRVRITNSYLYEAIYTNRLTGDKSVFRIK